MLNPCSRLLLPSFSRSSHRLSATRVLQAHLLRSGRLPGHVDVSSELAPLLQDPSDAARWKALLAALSRRGFHSLTLRTFSLMNTLGVAFDSYTFCTVLTAVSCLRVADLGAQVHGCAVRSGWLSSIFLGGALIDWYAKSGGVEDASRLFDEIPARNSVCANSLLSGYIERQCWRQGLSLLRRMHELGLEPDNFTLSAALRICAEVPALELGLQVHGHLVRRFGSADADAFFLSALVDMYGKCGLVAKARLVFDAAAGRAGRTDVVVWTSMLNAYGRNGRFKEVLAAYDAMLAEGTEPDEIVLLVVLSACGRSGDVAKGLRYFESMKRDHEMVPGQEHFGCIVDMLCKAGNLERAWEFANEMMLEKRPCYGGNGGDDGSVSVWGALLSACKECRNVDIGKLAAERALELEPGNTGIYVELCNLYAETGRWSEIEEMRVLMEEKGLRKDAGRSRSA